MKDFFDLHEIARRCEFEGAVLTEAVKRTFQRRNSSMEDADAVLAAAFFADGTLAQRWRAYLQSSPSRGHAPAAFAELGDVLQRFLRPILESMRGTRALGRYSDATGWGGSLGES